MSEVINTNLEKLFFAKIMDEPNQFSKVQSKYFENEQIRFIYDIIRTYYLDSKEKIVPSAKQIWSMISLVDSQKLISQESFKALIINNNTDDVSDEWLDDKFKAWKSSKYTRDKIYESIDIIRKMDDMDSESVNSVIERLKTSFSEIDAISNDDEDLGGDFDDPEEHKLLVSKRKMSSGWSNVDKILGGGWDKGTLNIVMGQTNVGKCVSSCAKLTIRNKKTGMIQNVTISELYEWVKRV